MSSLQELVLYQLAPREYLDFDQKLIGLDCIYNSYVMRFLL